MNQPLPTTRQLTAARAALVARLRGEIARRSGRRGRISPAVPRGGQLSELLPRGGIEPGTLVDWLYESPGNGTGTLALLSAREALNQQTTLIVIDPERQFYPPAAAALGVDFQQMVLVRPPAGQETLWTWEQALRSPAVGAVWGLLSRIEPRAFRRLQLAAEAGQAVGHLVRPARCRTQASWAHTQLLVEAGAGSRRRVTVTRTRQGGSGQSVELEPFRARSA